MAVAARRLPHVAKAAAAGAATFRATQQRKLVAFGLADATTRHDTTIAVVAHRPTGQSIGSLSLCLCAQLQTGSSASERKISIESCAFLNNASAN